MQDIIFVSVSLWEALSVIIQIQNPRESQEISEVKE